jgi:tyrosine-protein kinase Etk/Wzc
MSDELPARSRPSQSLPQLGSGPPPVESGSPGPQPDSAPPQGGGADWRRYLAALLRYKWLVVLVTAVGMVGGVGAARLAKPRYLAEATVWIETSDRKDAGPIRSSQLLGSSGWLELLRSFRVLDDAVQRLRLYIRLETPGDSGIFGPFRLKQRFVPGEYRLSVDDGGGGLTLATIDGVVLDRVGVGDSIGGSLGFAWVPAPDALGPGQEIVFSVVTPRDAARLLAKDLRANAARDGNFLRVELTGNDPVLTTATLNAVVDRFVEVAAQLKRAKLSEFARILEEQLRQAERNLREAEIGLESFRVQTITLPSERATPVAPGIELTRDPAFENFVSMKVEGEQLDRDREAIQRALAQMADSALSVAALEVIPAVRRSTEVAQALSELTDKQAELRALRYRYTSEHPTVRRMESEVRELEGTTIPSLVRALIAEVAARQAELDSRIQSASQELQQIPPRAIREARLRRDVTVAEGIYTMLQQRYEGARLAEASSIPDVRILDPAVVPVRPLKSLARRLIAMGFAGGLGLGLVGAVLLDRMDRKVRYPQQVTTELGLPLLGAVPHLKGMRGGATAGSDDSVIEALRGVRLNLVHAYGAAGPILLTVTSPEAGDGKSFIAANLALAFAAAGHQSLLIDGDTRRGYLHRVLNVARKPGLTDYLSGNAARAGIVQETDFRSLYFVGCGTRLREAPELLGSAAMSQFVTNLRASYGVIVIDSPPLGAGVDAFALGTVTGNLLVVLRLGMTDRELAEAKLDVLDRLPVRVLGAVLNDVRTREVYRYYSYGLPGYEYKIEPEEGEVKLLGRQATGTSS